MLNLDKIMWALIFAKEIIEEHKERLPTLWCKQDDHTLEDVKSAIEQIKRYKMEHGL